MYLAGMKVYSSDATQGVAKKTPEVVDHRLYQYSSPFLSARPTD